VVARKETYKHINTVKKQQKTKEKKQRASVGNMLPRIVIYNNIVLLHAIIQYYTHHCYTNTNLKRIRCNFTENIFRTGELKIERCGAFQWSYSEENLNQKKIIWSY